MHQGSKVQNRESSVSEVSPGSEASGICSYKNSRLVLLYCQAGSISGAYLPPEKIRCWLDSADFLATLTKNFLKKLSGITW